MSARLTDQGRKQANTVCIYSILEWPRIAQAACEARSIAGHRPRLDAPMRPPSVF